MTDQDMNISNSQSDSVRIIVLEEKTKNNTNRIDKLEDTVPSLSRLETILEMQVEINKNQTEQMERQNLQAEKTFNAVNESLTKLNFATERLKEEIDNVNEKVDRDSEETKKSIADVKSQVEEESKRGRFHIEDIGIKIFWGIVAIIPTLISLWIASKAGLG